MRRIAIAPLIAAVALVGGLVVGSAPAGASVPVKNNSCKVLKGSDVTKVTGFIASKAITRPGPPRAAICGYSLADPATTRDVSVFVLPHGAQEAKIGYRTAKKAFKDQIEPVSGFGKNAFYAGGGLNTLYVLKGDTLLYVQYVALAEGEAPGIKAAVEAMTKIALARV